MNPVETPDLITAARKTVIWALVTTALLDGGGSLLLMYLGTPLMKFVILIAVLLGVLLVWRRPVYPLAHLFTDQVEGLWDNPMLASLATGLHAQKGRCVLGTSLGWIALLSAIGGMGLLDPPQVTAWFEVGWPFTIYIILIVTGLSLAGTAAILWLVIHLAAIRQAAE